MSTEVSIGLARNNGYSCNGIVEKVSIVNTVGRADYSLT